MPNSSFKVGACPAGSDRKHILMVTERLNQILLASDAARMVKAGVYEHV